MVYPSILPPQERDQVIMDGVIFSHNLAFREVNSINRYRGALEIIFLSDITTAEGRYLKHFIFGPGGKTSQLHYKFPREQPTREDWDQLINFWHSFATTGGKLNVPLGRWSNKTHWKWKWFYNQGKDELYHIDGKTIIYYKCKTGWRQTRSTTSYKLAKMKKPLLNSPTGVLTSVVALSINKVNKLQEGSDLPVETLRNLSFWEYIATWSGNWMWEDIDDSQTTKADTSWIAEGLKAGTLIWTTDGS